MALVVTHLEVFELVVEDGFGFALDVQCGCGQGRARELQLYLLVVVAVDVAVAAGPNEVAYLEVALLRHHVGQERIAGDVEWHTQEYVGTSLIQLTTQLSFATSGDGRCHIKLEESML